MCIRDSGDAADITEADLEPFLAKIEADAARLSKARQDQRRGEGTAEADRATALAAAQSLAEQTAATTGNAAVEAVEGQLIAAVDQIRGILNADPLTINLEESERQLREIAESLKGLDAQGPSPEIQTAYSTLVLSVRDYLIQLEAARAAQQAINDNPVKDAGYLQLGNSVDSVTSSINQATNATIQLGNAAAAAAQQVAAAVAAAASAGSGSFANTGRFFFNAGGLARGSDTIPAMLGRGESVINARSTARFFGQINAMNAGQMPSPRGQSSVTNVGDIHINMSSNASSSAINAREIASGIRRELRRGTSRL